jgi:hypothetical protein
VERVRQGLQDLNDALVGGELMDLTELFDPEIEWHESAQLIDRPAGCRRRPTRKLPA